MSALLDEVKARRGQPSRQAARAVRLAAGVSQARLAAELGVHPVTVARWEAGTRRPSVAVRARYAALIDQLRTAAS